MIANATPYRLSRFLVGVSICLTLIIQLYLWEHITDDAFISFRYADRLAAGSGLTFNDGERTEGFSNPLWTVGLGALRWVTRISVPDIARGVGLLCGVLTLWGLALIIKLLSVESSIHVLSVALLLTVLSPGFHVYATAGLEGPLLSFLLILVVVQTLRGRSVSAAMLLGLVAVTRPEGILYGLLWVVATGTRGDGILSQIRSRFREVALIVFLPVLWQIFRVWYYDAWLPNTAVAKPPGTFGSFTVLGSYLQPWIISLGGPLIVCLWFFIRWEKQKVSSRVLRASWGLLIAAAAFLLYARGDWMPFGRFVVPVWPIVAVCFSIWLVPVVREMQTKQLFRFERLVVPAMYCALVACSVFAWQMQVRNYIANKEMNMLMRGKDQLAVGTWLANSVKEGSTVATGRLGGISYGAPKLTVFDLNGLTDREEAGFVAGGRRGGVGADPVLKRKPDVMALIDVPVEWGYKNETELMEWLQPRYTFVRSFPQGNYGAVDIWVATDNIEAVMMRNGH